MNNVKKELIREAYKAFLDIGGCSGRLNARKLKNQFPKYFKEEKPKTLTELIEKYEYNCADEFYIDFIKELKEVTKL